MNLKGGVSRGFIYMFIKGPHWYATIILVFGSVEKGTEEVILYSLVDSQGDLSRASSSFA